MAWLKVEQSLPNHRKTLLGSQLAAMDKHKFMGHVLEFWLWALDHADDNGRLPTITPEMLGVQAGVLKRQAKAFIETLVEVGFLDRIDRELLIHDWPLYAGRLNERREKERQRIANKRSALHQQVAEIARRLHD